MISKTAEELQQQDEQYNNLEIMNININRIAHEAIMCGPFYSDAGCYLHSGVKGQPRKSAQSNTQIYHIGKNPIANYNHSEYVKAFENNELLMKFGGKCPTELQLNEIKILRQNRHSRNSAEQNQHLSVLVRKWKIPFE